MSIGAEWKQFYEVNMSNYQILKFPVDLITGTSFVVAAM